LTQPHPTGISNRKPVINLPIAVIVQSIAHFGGYITALTAGVGDIFIREPVAIIVYAIAELRGNVTAHAAGIQLAFIVLTIAVVVSFVTHFVGWRDATPTFCFEKAIDACLGALLADADVGPAGNGLLGFAYAAFVGLAVTVLVSGQVAVFDAGGASFRVTGQRHSVHITGQNTFGLAGPDTDSADLSDPLDIVDNAIAIIIFAITDFGNWRTFGGLYGLIGARVSVRVSARVSHGHVAIHWARWRRLWLGVHPGIGH
jgi:hypothetical protein